MGGWGGDATISFVRVVVWKGCVFASTASGVKTSHRRLLLPEYRPVNVGDNGFSGLKRGS